MLKSSGKTASSTPGLVSRAQQFVGPLQIGRDIEKIRVHLDRGHGDLHGRSPRSIDRRDYCRFYLDRLDTSGKIHVTSFSRNDARKHVGKQSEYLPHKR